MALDIQKEQTPLRKNGEKNNTTFITHPYMAATEECTKSMMIITKH